MYTHTNTYVRRFAYDHTCVHTHTHTHMFTWNKHSLTRPPPLSYFLVQLISVTSVYLRDRQGKKREKVGTCCRICICIIHLYGCIHTYTHNYAHPCIHIHTHTHTHTSLTYTRTQIHLGTLVFLKDIERERGRECACVGCIFVCMSWLMYTHTYTQVYKLTHAHTITRTHTRTYVHTHTQSILRRLWYSCEGKKIER